MSDKVPPLQLNERRNSLLHVIRDNSMVHCGQAVPCYPATLVPRMGLMNLPCHGPDLNAEESIWS